MKKFESLNEFAAVIHKQKDLLDHVPEEYLNDAGLAKREALRKTSWYLSFYDNLKDLFESDEILDILNIEGKHPEYYKTLGRIYDSLAYSVK